MKLANSTESELRTLQSGLQAQKDDVAVDLQRNVFKKYGVIYFLCAFDFFLTVISKLCRVHARVERGQHPRERDARVQGGSVRVEGHAIAFTYRRLSVSCGCVSITYSYRLPLVLISWSLWMQSDGGTSVRQSQTSECCTRTRCRTYTCRLRAHRSSSPRLPAVTSSPRSTISSRSMRRHIRSTTLCALSSLMMPFLSHASASGETTQRATSWSQRGVGH